ncbi:MAG TPA: hypothetical protein VFV97_11640 [Rhodanobacteraceae bacterium]|nr:hypothetical protein [Rhodanobacteraceae bacterium]
MLSSGAIAEPPAEVYAVSPHSDIVRGETVRSDARGARARATHFVSANSPQPAGTGTGNWSLLGPPGGDVADVAASPTAAGVVLAGVAPGGSWGGTMYRSTDDGATWAPVANFANRSVHDIEFAPDGKVWAATQDAVWSSTDDGVTWTHHTLTGVDPNNDEVFDVAIDPSNADTIWIGVTDAGGGQLVNLMRSTNGGTSWTDMTPPLATPMVGAAIAIDPNDSNTVIAGFHGDFGGGAVWVTTNGGTSWDERDAGLGSEPINALVYDGTRLLVGGGELFGSQFLGLYTSPDLGVTWTELDDGTWPLLVVTDIAVDPNDSQTILVSTDGAGINRTTNGGTSWDTGIGGTGALATQSIRFAPGSSTGLFGGATSLAVWKSSDGGDTFAESSTGISELPLFAIASSPTDPLQIAVAFQGNNSGGVFSSSDGGVSWIVESAPPTRYSKVGYSPDGTLYAISSGPSSVAPEGLYRREGDGSWTSLGPDQGTLYESDLASLRFSINNADLILLGGSDFGVAGFAVTVWRSLDAGATWTKVYAGRDYDFTTDIEIVEDGTDENMVASYDGFTEPNQGGAFNSTDGGATWNLALNGLPDYARSPRLCTSLADPGTIWMSAATEASHSSVFHTEDAGASWSSTGWSGDFITDIACDPSNAQVLYVAQGTGAKAARSDDQGVSFTDFDTGLDNAGAPRDIAITADTSAPRLLMATDKGSYATPIPGGGVTDRIFADGFDGP